MALRSEGVTLQYKRIIAELYAQRLFLFHEERWHEYGTALEWSGTPSEGRAEPCRGAFKGCRLCRRAPKLDDWMTRCLEMLELTAIQSWLAGVCWLEARMSGNLWRPVAACGGLWHPVAPCGTLWQRIGSPIESSIRF